MNERVLHVERKQNKSVPNGNASQRNLFSLSVPVNKISKVVVQFRVVSGGKVSPAEGRVLGLRPHEGKIKAEDVGRNVGLLGIRAKDAKPTALGELPTLVV